MPSCGITTEDLTLRILSGTAAGVYTGTWNAIDSRWDFPSVPTVGDVQAEWISFSSQWAVGPNPGVTELADSHTCSPAFLASWGSVASFPGSPAVELSLAADPASGGCPLCVNTAPVCGLFGAYPWPDLDVDVNTGPVGTYRVTAYPSSDYTWFAQIGGSDLSISYPAPGWTYTIFVAYDPGSQVFSVSLANSAGSVIAYTAAGAWTCNPFAATADQGATEPGAAFGLEQVGSPASGGLALVLDASALTTASFLPLVLPGLATESGGLALVTSGKEPVTGAVPLVVEGGTGTGVNLFVSGAPLAADGGLPLVLESEGPTPGSAALPLVLLGPSSTPASGGLNLFVHTGSAEAGVPLVVQSEGFDAAGGVPLVVAGAEAAAGGVPLAVDAVSTKAAGTPLYTRGW